MTTNPTVTIGNSIPIPVDPALERITYTKVAFDSKDFKTYGLNEYDATYTGFVPTKLGEDFYMFVPLDFALAPGGIGPGSGVQPDFVNFYSWDDLKKAPSGFITAVNSIMPKIIIPSEILVDNGLVTTNETGTGMYYDGTAIPPYQGLFNWNLISFNGVVTGATESYKYIQPQVFPGSSYISSKAKNDTSSTNTLVLKLQNPSIATPGNPPPQGGIAHGWLATDSSNLVVGGAFILMLNVVPSKAASAASVDVAKVKWSVKMVFGEVSITIDDSGSSEVTITSPAPIDETNSVPINLAEGKAKGGPPQQEHILEKSPFIILVYPVWNGLVVSSGVQDAKATVFSSSYYVRKIKSASVLNSPYSTAFDPQAPAEVLVNVGTPATDDYVMVDFGTEMNVTVNNCRIDLAYLPCFFSKQCWFDEWHLRGDDVIGTIAFEYDIYPIWTKNNTSSNLDPVSPPAPPPGGPTVEDSGFAGSIADTHYTYTKWRLSQDYYNRVGGEIFGSYLRVKTTLDYPIKNGNGAFDVVFTADKPGDPSPSASWKDYIQSVSVTVGLDGSSGSITVDKFGIAGQGVIADQSIGAITISATGAADTIAGSIFQGLGIGIADNRTSDGAVWTIPLVGLEKKMDDIALVNAPFLDGETMQVACDWLCKYAGLIPDYTYTDPTRQLGGTDDPNSVRFDWKTGTTVKAALEEVMKDLLNHYVVRDGKIFFYLLNDVTGLPDTGLGPDRKISYPDNTHIVMYDANPDFEDMRNQIAVVGMEQIPDGEGTKIEGLSVMPRLSIRNDIATTPDIPWARTYVQPIAGFEKMAYFNEQADRLAAKYSVYELIGKTTIPGNADIKPYDQWGDFIISGVTHNIDLKAKSWITDLEFMRKTR